VACCSDVAAASCVVVEPEVVEVVEVVEAALAADPCSAWLADEVAFLAFSSSAGGALTGGGGDSPALMTTMVPGVRRVAPWTAARMFFTSTYPSRQMMREKLWFFACPTSKKMTVPRAAATAVGVRTSNLVLPTTARILPSKRL